jgi:hypothetical protein
MPLIHPVLPKANNVIVPLITTFASTVPKNLKENATYDMHVPWDVKCWMRVVRL